ncbi:hypothetical protein [Methylotetracoccus oryzae]|uniref:hypothetical protein n=1 Tax=Methylotetracoccus oryzae TaxID=1919059 RepID=UPI0011198597|nr:hypothetical protein [Methylotetracoccus oryzae]
MKSEHERKMSGVGARLLLAVTIACAAGCDNAPSGSRSGAAPVSTQLTGHVLNDDGPVTAATIEATDGAGVVAARTELKGDSVYQLTIPAGTRYPLVITAYPAENPGEPIKAAVTNPDAAEQDISAVTTIVVNTAMGLGGLSEANLAKAAGAAIAQRRKSGGGSGGAQTTESFKGDPTKQYGGWH